MFSPRHAIHPTQPFKSREKIPSYLFFNKSKIAGSRLSGRQAIKKTLQSMHSLLIMILNSCVDIGNNSPSFTFTMNFPSYLYF